MKIDMKRLVGMGALAILGVVVHKYSFDSVTWNGPLKVILSNGSERTFDQSVSSSEAKTDGLFTVHGTLTQNLFSSGTFNILFDDCIKGVTANGVSVPLDTIPENKRCDLSKGVVLNFSGYLKNGENQISIQILNTAGNYGFSMHRLQPSGSKIFSLVLTSALLGWTLLLLIQFFSGIFEQAKFLKSPSTRQWVGALMLGVVGYFVYIHRIGDPPSAYWDENYYITDAQRYLDGTFFMQIHPPLGKLVIAASNLIFGDGQVFKELTVVEHAKNFPAGFDFFSYRILPALFAFGSAILFYLSCCLLMGSPLAALGISLVYVLENSMAVHFRGAMLDGVFQFFVFLTIWGLLRFWDQTKRRARNSGFLSFVLIGGALGATLSVKYSGAFLLVGLVFLVIGQGKKWLPIFRSLGVVMASALVVFVSVWVTHLTIGSKVQVALKDKGRYIASERTIASDSQEFHPSAGAYLSGLKDNLRYFSVYSAGIPKLDFRKSDENGSPAIIWPLAGKGINYRWDREGSYTSYLQLQGNPIVYWLGIAGLIFGIVYLFLPLFLERGKLDLNQTKRVQIAVLALLYLAYMTPMWMANRVLFLYTYFPALGISLLLLGAVFSEMAVFKSLVGRRATICAAVALVTVMFVFFSPLTYHQPLSPSELESRAWFKLWDLHCSSCERSFSWIGN